MTAWPGDPKDWLRGHMGDEVELNKISNALRYLKEQMDLTAANLAASKGAVRGLVARSHPDADKFPNKLIVSRLEQAVLQTGLGVADWTAAGPLTLDLSVVGANGLDTGAEAASTWYEMYGIHKSTDGTKGLLGHRAPDNFKDEEYDSDDASAPTRNVASNRTASGQGVKVDTSGKCPYVDLELIRAGAVVGNIWLEIQADDGAGRPNGTVLATSDIFDASLIDTAALWVRFIFRNPATLSAATQYHLVLTGSWTQSDTVDISWRYDSTAASYSNGTRTAKDAGVWTNSGMTTHDMSFRVYITRNESSVTLPAGYDGYVKLGYFYNKSDSAIRQFQIRDRMHLPLEGNDIGSPAGSGTVPTLVDMSAYVPPGAVVFTFWLRNGANTSWDIRVGPVPDGFFLGPGHRARGQTRMDGGLSGGITFSFGSRMEAIITETQALYVRAGAGTIDALVVSSWEW